LSKSKEKGRGIQEGVHFFKLFGQIHLHLPVGVAQKSNAKELPLKKKQICASILILPGFHPVTPVNPLKVPRNSCKQAGILSLKAASALNGRKSAIKWGKRIPRLGGSKTEIKNGRFEVPIFLGL